MTWTPDELRQIDAAQELEIAPQRRDGTLRRPTPIWVVRAGDDVYVRAAYGPATGWHGVARRSRAGHIRAGGVDSDVAIEGRRQRLRPGRRRVPRQVRPLRRHRRRHHQHRSAIEHAALVPRA